MNFQQKTERTALRRIMACGLIASFFLMGIVFSACERAEQMMAPAEEPMVTPEEADTIVKLGMLYSSPLPGTTLSGAELAVSEINAAGGINGMSVALIAKDDTNDTAMSVALANELIAAGVAGIIGPDFSVHAFQVGPVVQAAGIPMITTYPTNPTVPDAGDFVFMGAFTDNYQGELIAKFAAESLSAKKAAILTQSGLAYSEGLSQYFKVSLMASGEGVEVLQVFYDENDTDFTTQLTEIAAMEPDVIFIPDFVPMVTTAIQQARAAGITATFLGGDGWDNPQLLEMGGDALEGSFFVNHFSGLLGADLGEDTSHFVAAYTEKYGMAPDGPASLGYDAVRIMVQAMQRAGDMSGDAIRAQVAATMDYSGATLLSKFDENRHAIKSGVIITISEGALQTHQVIAP